MVTTKSVYKFVISLKVLFSICYNHMRFPFKTDPVITDLLKTDHFHNRPR